MFHKTTDCSLPQLESAPVPNMQRRWKHLHSGVAGGGGWSATPDSEFAKNREKNLEKVGENRKNREEKAKIGKVLHFATPDRQGWLRSCIY